MTLAITTFRVDAIPPPVLEAIREAGQDNAGNPFRPCASESGNEPLRCCLRFARAGDRVALIAYHPPGGTGAYHETGPVFVHAARCDGYPADGGWPADFRGRQQVLRAYGHDGRIADARLIDASEAEHGISALLDDPRVALIQSRNVMYGCYMFAITRADR